MGSEGNGQLRLSRVLIKDGLELDTGLGRDYLQGLLELEELIRRNSDKECKVRY
jgi:hypothetical protein